MNKIVFNLLLLFLTIDGYSQRIGPINNLADANRFFLKNISYSQNAIDCNQKGVVVVAFTVRSDGRVYNPKVVLSQGNFLTESTLDGIRKSSGNWKNWTTDSIHVILPVYYDVDDSNGPPQQLAEIIPATTILNGSVIIQPVTVIAISISCYPPIEKSAKKQ